jgi:hypothetical protein
MFWAAIGKSRVVAPAIGREIPAIQGVEVFMRGQSRTGKSGIATALVALALGVPGCSGSAGDALPRQAIRGTVNLAGSPLKSGQIQFQPTSGDAVTAGAAEIEAGAYSIAQDEGLIPGSYKVTITGAPAVGANQVGVMPGDSAPPPREPIPGKYNAKSRLTAEVKADAPNAFNFELDAK